MDGEESQNAPAADSLIAKLGDPVLRGALFETIIENMNESVLIVDRSGKQLYGNKVLREFSGENAATADKDEWRKPRLMTISDMDGRELAPDQWPVARALRGDQQDNFEIRVIGMRHAPGETILVISTRTLRDAEGNIEGAVIVTHDVTAARQTEERLRQSQKLETIGQLTGGIAHDFNNMLAAILSSAEVLKRGVPAQSTLEQAANTVEKAALRGAELTRHLLAFARRQNLQPTEVDVGALVRDALLILRPGVGAFIDLRVEGDTTPLYARADAAQLTSALLNLCLNARDAMPEGGALRISVERAQVGAEHAVLAPGAYACISVSDTGAGMSEEVQRRAIEPFFTTKEVGKGSGLGLSMVFGFVRQSGGDMSITSTLGVGTTISLLLPETSAPDARESAAEAPAGIGRMRVLVVDDDEMVRGALMLQLADEGFEPVCAKDGPEALRLLETGTEIDILLTDMVMPNGMSGADLARAVRQRLPQVRVIVSTGYAEEDLAGDEFTMLRKPYSAHQLLAALRQAVLAEA